jgi:NOL1/NOP2/sun family putative RNA methylase
MESSLLKKMPLNTEEKKDKFLQKIKEIFPEEYEKVIQAVNEPKKLSFRVNTLKADKEEILRSLVSKGFVVKEGPVQDSYYIESDPGTRLSETDEFKSGLIYIQSFASMLPVLMLDPKPGEKIIDLCAAPGSKTSQIAVLSSGGAEITAVENNRNRFFSLMGNLQLQGVENVKFLMENSSYLYKKNPSLTGHYDKVLADVPCSNEGLICLSRPETLKGWNPKSSKSLPKLQKSIIAAGIKMLKPGGTLVYSTCTFSRDENENVVEWALERFKEMELVEVKRVVPDEYFTAFFAAKLLKTL